jgi:tetratricopeptide (TPR) repeat protein
MSIKAIFPVAALAALGLIALIYWPVHQAGFVWVDKIFFYDNAWLRYGDSWRHLVFRNFYDWSEYFRPLVIALFVLQLHAFDVAPGPMHLVSLGVHLASTLLVGLVALRLTPQPPATVWPKIFTIAAMLLYGLHPALAEPVVWIACQFELIVNFFILLGLLLNLQIKQRGLRACAIAICFFLAACSHESAVAFPLLLVLVDWVRAEVPLQAGTLVAMRSLWRRQWPVYLGVFGSGIAYLAVRYWGLGFLLHGSGKHVEFSIAHLQTVCFIYLTYWRVLLWPMLDLGPLHVVDTSRFISLSGASLAIDCAAVALLGGGIYLAWKRNPMGCLIMAVTIALLPVLHILPIADASLYHERYALIPLAMACAFLPCVLAGVAMTRRIAVVTAALVAAWLGLAIMNNRVSIPAWSDETRLWLLELRQHPESEEAKVHLLSTYLEQNDRPHARELAAQMMLDTHPCATCMINIANLSLADGNVAIAEDALDRAKKSMHPQESLRTQQTYIVAIGQLRELKHDIPGAEEAFRDAITLDPFNAQAQMSLALMLARQSDEPAARKALNDALPLFSPSERENQRKLFELTLLASSTTKTIVPH